MTYNTKQLPSGEVDEIIDTESWDAPVPFSLFPLGYLFLVLVVPVAFCVGLYYAFGCAIDVNCLTWLR